MAAARPAPAPAELHVGGPRQGPERLRDLLADKVAAVPEGGAIDIVTYYLRDRRLAAHLLAAQRRGVSVRVTLEGRPRTPHANDAAIRLLAGPRGLGDGLRAVTHARLGGSRRKDRRPRLHTKLYCFSHPGPAALLGSFNPSGDRPEEDPEAIREIGDQDRGRNLLVELRDPAAVSALREHARHLHRKHHGPLERFAPRLNRELAFGDLRLWFAPRLRPAPVFRFLRGLGRGHRVRIAASHMKGRAFLGALRDLARRGAHVTVLAEATHRRIPPATGERLRAAGIALRRVDDPPGLPMHDKFLLAEHDGARTAIFGSFNWTDRSLHLNHELGALTTDAALFEAFEARWQELTEAADRTEQTHTRPPGETHARSEGAPGGGGTAEA